MPLSLSRFPDHPNRSKLRGIHLKIKESKANNDSPQEIWKIFGSFIHNKGLNKDINPLNHAVSIKLK
jgi:hypothetical protein